MMSATMIDYILDSLKIKNEKLSFFGRIKRNISHYFSKRIHLKAYIHRANIYKIFIELVAIADMMEKSYFKDEDWATKFNPPLNYICSSKGTRIDLKRVSGGTDAIELTRWLFSFKQKDSDYGYYVEGNLYIPESSIDLSAYPDEELNRLASIDFYVRMVDLKSNQTSSYRYGTKGFNSPEYISYSDGGTNGPSIMKIASYLLRECIYETMLAIENYFINH